MKIWILLYIAGKLALAWGPLPVYRTLDQCSAAMSNDNEVVALRSDGILKCIKADTLPELGSDIKDLK